MGMCKFKTTFRANPCEMLSSHPVILFRRVFKQVTARYNAQYDSRITICTRYRFTHKHVQCQNGNRNLIKISIKGRRPAIAPEAKAMRFWHFGGGGGNSDIKFTYSTATSTSLGADTDKRTLFSGPHFLYHTFVPISIQSAIKKEI